MLPPEKMSEAYFRKKVIDPWLNKNSEYWFATTGVLCRNGIPDYTCVINSVPVFIEAKRVGKEPTPYQVNEIKRIKEANILVYVADPLNWSNVAKDIARETARIRSERLDETDTSHIKINDIYTIKHAAGNC